jgi:molecular chaperone DnaJ
MAEDLYDVLGVPTTASPAEITRAYRRLARCLHPDACPDDPAAADRFARVTAAYRILADPRQRATYDRLRLAAGETAGPSLQGQRIPVTIVDSFTADSLFEASPFANSSFSTSPFSTSPFSTSPFFDPAAWTVRQRPTGRPTPRRGRDTAELTVDFADAITGTDITVEATTPGQPSQRVRIPPGVKDGQRLRVPGVGRRGRDGSPTGDLDLTVRVRSHPRFARRGDDLTITVPITFAEAVTGARITIAGLDRRPIFVEVPPGTHSGDTVRIPGAGVRTRNGAGDLLVTVSIDVPTMWTATQRAALDALAHLLPDPRASIQEEA